MSAQKNLLVELLVEELPPKALKKLGESFSSELVRSLMLQGLVTADLAFPDIERDYVRRFASPRRLALHLKNVYTQAPGTDEHIKLMPIKVGLGADGQATPALLKKLAALGESAEVVPALRRDEDGVLYLDRKKEGVVLADGLQKALEETINKLPIPKAMQYQLADGWETVNFVRPAHGLVALHGADIVSVAVLGLQAGRATQGHRFEAASAAMEIRDADSYEAQMENEGAVIPNFGKRGAVIAGKLREAATKVGGGAKPVVDEALLDEVTALVERPNVLVGQFDPAFLEVPQECLILTMKANQKYFPLLDAAGRLTNQFLMVSNVSPADPSAVIAGNERVVRPRLADAKFFYDQDRKKRLEDRVLGLAKVVYHGKLGSQGERVGRVQAIARAIGERLGGAELARLADHAALLAKADLLTDMVGEFPELQGTMGRYYALHDGEDPLVAEAIEDHYKPRFAGDVLPRSEVGLVVALADKLETLVGLFGIGEKPTGDKDPFALRRHALGVVRMLTERDLPLELPLLLRDAARAFAVDLRAETLGELEDFIYERLSNALREGGNGSTQAIEAVLKLRPARLGDVAKRLTAVNHFAVLAEAPTLAAANKRVGNILKKSAAAPVAEVNSTLLREPAERALAESLATVGPQAKAAYERGDYTASLQALALLKAPVDAFFDEVMVNVDDPVLRANRLALLGQLHAAMNRVADLSALSA